MESEGSVREVELVKESYTHAGKVELSYSVENGYRSIYSNRSESKLSTEVQHNGFLIESRDRTNFDVRAPDYNRYTDCTENYAELPELEF